MSKPTNVTAAKIADLRDYLEMSFTNTAEWRSGLVHRFPNDDRNAFAASELRRLSDTVKDVSGDLMQRYADLDGFEFSEKENELRKEIGFYGTYGNATEFVEALIA